MTGWRWHMRCIVHGMTQRFQALDGFRGLCALAVLEFHLTLAGGIGCFQHGYLAVDAFFLVSGVVLAAAYEAKLAAGLGASAFLRARIRRLGPVLWTGLGACVTGFVAARVYNHQPLDAGQSLILLRWTLQNAFLIPLLSPHPVEAFPLNGGSWSLLAELAVNGGFAYFWPRLGNRVLGAVALGGYALLLLLAGINGSADFGALQTNVLFAVPRAVPSFAAGILLYRQWRSGGLARLPSLPALPLLGLAFLMLALLPAHAPALIDVGIVALGWPLLVALLLRRNGAMPRWLNGLGDLSYPLYASHPAIVGFVLATEILGRRGHWSVFAVLLLTGLALALAVLVRWITQPRSRQVRHPAIGQRLGDMPAAHRAGA